MSHLFRVMTFNVRGSIYPDSDNVWPQRAALNVATIQRHAPDLIGFQEVQHGNLATYTEVLTGYDVEPGPPAVIEGEGEQCEAIYWRQDRFERLASGGFYLSETPDMWSVGWGAYLVRAANWVRLRDRLSGHTLLHLNTHLDHKAHAARLNGAALVIERIEALRRANDAAALPVIVTGDFNDPAVVQPAYPAQADRVHDAFTARGFRDTYQEVGLPDVPAINTFHNFQGEAFDPLGLRIDWVLVRDGDAQALTTQAAAIVRDSDPPIYPSDHYPVLADLAWATQPGS